MYEMLSQELPVSPDVWAKNGGILGLIILFLLIGTTALVRWLVGYIGELNTLFRDHLDKQADKHRSERAEWQAYYERMQDQHREERAEWREAAAASNETLRQAIETQNHELAQEIENGLEQGLEKMFDRIEQKYKTN